MLDYTYADFQKRDGELHFDEFLNMIWSDHISEKIVSNAYYAQNEDFISALTFDFYRLFQVNNCMTMRFIARSIESFFFNLFRYKGNNYDVENSEDI